MPENIESQSGDQSIHPSSYILNKLKISLPGLSEQRTIAPALGALDDTIELNRQMNATLEQIGQAIFKHWFVGFEFPNEDDKPYRSSGVDM